MLRKFDIYNQLIIIEVHVFYIFQLSIILSKSYNLLSINLDYISFSFIEYVRERESESGKQPLLGNYL